jgi:glycosyltransferase involved in cell wall biosynthesis
MISAIILTKNEEKNIIDCIESAMFCSEIIVIDDSSEDNTVELVRNFSKSHSQVKFFSRELNNDFSAQREFAIMNASNDWIMFVDADEKITDDLATEIKENVTPSTTFAGFLIPRADFMWGRRLEHGETGNIKLLRLFNKNKGKLIGKVHERWETKERVGYLVNPILHYPHPTVTEFLKEINFYTTLRAKELYDERKKVGFLSILFYPKAKFFVNFILKRGFMDGNAGLVHATLMSFHSFLVRGKLWLLWRNNSEKN